MGHRNPSTLVLADIRREAGVLEQLLRQHRFHPLTWHRRVESHDGMDDRAPFLGTRRDGPNMWLRNPPNQGSNLHRIPAQSRTTHLVIRIMQSMACPRLLPLHVVCGCVNEPLRGDIIRDARL